MGPDGILDLVDNVSVLRGKHAFKFGGEVLNMQNPVGIGSSKGSVGASRTFRRFFNGVPNKASFSRRSKSPQALQHRGIRRLPSRTIGTSNQEFNSGSECGYEIDTVLKDSNGLLGNFNPNSLRPVWCKPARESLLSTPATTTTSRHGSDSAWDVRGDGKTVVRVGGNIIFEQLTNDVFGGAAGGVGLAGVPTGVPLYDQANGQTPLQSGGTINAVATTYNGAALKGSTTNGGGPGDIAYDWQTNATNPLFSDVSPACGDGNVPVHATGITPTQCAISGVNPNLRSPYVTTWTLVLEHAITNNLGLEVAYVGNHGTKLISLE